MEIGKWNLELVFSHFSLIKNCEENCILIHIHVNLKKKLSQFLQKNHSTLMFVSIMSFNNILCEFNLFSNQILYTHYFISLFFLSTQQKGQHFNLSFVNKCYLLEFIANIIYSVCLGTYVGVDIYYCLLKNADKA
jgi:hypothetical protein